MELLLNFAFAWAAVIIALFVAVAYITRKLASGDSFLADCFKLINRALRKHHKLWGFFLILVGLAHGALSSEKVLSLNLGTISWVISILLGLNYVFRRSLSEWGGWMYYHRGLTLLFIAALVLHVADVGIQAPYLLQSYLNNGGDGREIAALPNDLVDKITTSFEDLTLKDGVYEGEATGFREGLKVSVTVNGNKITDIKILSHNEVGERYFQKPMETIPKAIINSQSLDVDTITGATCTSVGIINAVNDALSKAVISGTLPEMRELPVRGHGRGGRGGGRHERYGDDSDFRNDSEYTDNPGFRVDSGY
ncbi:MAG TPA: FMN-binding protein, partial [Clostridia bacterium]|nr:FMN-binding protein [Clostridia bacterium]